MTFPYKYQRGTNSNMRMSRTDIKQFYNGINSFVEEMKHTLKNKKSDFLCNENEYFQFLHVLLMHGASVGFDIPKGLLKAQALLEDDFHIQ